jgi:uncharacterized protein YidB (DUF937 family)
MGLIDSAIGQVLGRVLGGGRQAGAGGDPLVQMLVSLVQSQPGGLGGLLDQFRRAGLGAQADSWVSTGQNLAVSGNDMEQALGAGALDDMAARLGVPRGKAADTLAGALPQLVDQLTPQGRVTEGDELRNALASVAGRLLRA